MGEERVINQALNKIGIPHLTDKSSQSDPSLAILYRVWSLSLVLEFILA